MKKYLAMLLALAMVFALCACGSTAAPAAPAAENAAPAAEAAAEPAAEEAAPAAEENSKYGGVLRVAVNHDIVNLGVAQKNLTFQAAVVADCCLEHLCRFYPDGSLEPWLIESYVEDPEALTLSVTLKQGIKFHDGSDFNAEAVVFNWKVWGECGNAELNCVSDFEIVDDYNIVLHLTDWNNSISMAALYTAGTMISKEYYEANGLDVANSNPCGTGPFKFVSWDVGEKVSFVKNENYWGVDADGNQLPYLDGIDFYVIMDPATLASAFLADEVDVVYNIGSETSMTLKAAGFESATKSLVSGASSTITWFSCQDEGPLGDVNVRRAIVSAIDMDAIWEYCSSQTGAIYDRTIQWGPNGVWSCNPETKGYPYDVEAAKAYLAQTEWPNGFDTTITYVDNSESAQIAVLYQDYLKEIGINATIQLVDEAQSAAISGMEKSDWSGLFISAGRAEVDLGTYYNRTFLPDGVRWVNQVNHYDDIVETLQAAMSAKTFDEKKAASQKLSKMVIDDYCEMMPMWTNNAACFAQPDVIDHGLYQINMIIWTPEICYLAK